MMTGPPANPKIYHITHLRNLSQVIQAGEIWSDSVRMARNVDAEIVGMSKIKERRLKVLDVDCHPGTKVGEYVPFYFCPRSIMLYILHMGNHPELTYRGGQRPILHLRADLTATIRWANQNGARWAFSDSNAGGCLASFFKSISDLDKINWAAFEATDFRSMQVKEGKQAEFLVYESFPWELVEHVGVKDEGIDRQVNDILRDARHKPLVTVEPSWYY
jgi:hypothetical protein